MKCLLAVAASLFTILLSVGCQKASPPAPDQSRAAQPQASRQVPGAADQNGPKSTGAGDESRPDADQPDDPGMTTARDKTVKQEEPSGDESSLAAPNEGDAEPPQ